ncbi:MAG: hypothetical protein IT353_21385 [Gemmatimonadaceae bacterium]|nr:hypothetical protein [Gemmatimonadaceae bacterium]
MTLEALLRGACDALRGSDIPFMLTGSVATAFHGASRATMDVDFVIDPTVAQLDLLVARMLASGAYVSLDAARDALRDRTMFNVIDPESGWKADLIIRKDRPFSAMEFGRRQSAEFFGTVIHVATLEDIVLSKLEWAKLGGSARQLDDVRGLLRIRAGDVDLAYISRWIDVLGVRTQWEVASTDDDRP